MINPSDEYIFTVKELNHKVKALLENNFAQIWISGEISNFSHPSSGHMYFTLKDNNAQIRCAYFKGKQWSLKCLPENGMEVIVCAKLSLYPERGDYQLIVEHVLPGGTGLLQQQFDALKAKLEKSGLFEPAHKKPLPTLIRNLAIITSKTGAALQDVLSVIKRRWPLLEISVFDSMVQGEKAPAEIISAIRRADKSQFDCILLTRGGGSLEDLWAFNDEALAHTIHRCETPIVSAVGHEVDFSIADFVADHRAPTPSAAAELLTPNSDNIRQSISILSSRLNNAVSNKLQAFKQHHQMLLKRIRTPQDLLDAKSQHLDYCQQRLMHLFQNQQLLKQQALANMLKRLHQHDPMLKLEQTRSRLHALQTHLIQRITTTLNKSNQDFALTTNKLNNISPLNTLQRGYALAQSSDGTVLCDVSQVKSGDNITVSLRHGKLHAAIIKTSNDEQ